MPLLGRISKIESLLRTRKMRSNVRSLIVTPRCIHNRKTDLQHYFTQRLLIMNLPPLRTFYVKTGNPHDAFNTDTRTDGIRKILSETKTNSNSSTTEGHICLISLDHLLWCKEKLPVKMVKY